jgi:N-glycosylase/DNA lyase
VLNYSIDPTETAMHNIALNTQVIDQFKKIYRRKKGEITLRLGEFRQRGVQASDEELFSELAFCLLTPQSRAKFCWEAIMNLKKQHVLLKGSADQIKRRLHCVRFHNKKASYLVAARSLFLRDGAISVKPLLEQHDNSYECREWLVENVKGLGYKEASHFLRNIGRGENMAILDRHILKNLHLLGVIAKIPETLSKTTYRQIETKMEQFALSINIPFAHLDLLLWYKETGEIFK